MMLFSSPTPRYGNKNKKEEKKASKQASEEESFLTKVNRVSCTFLYSYTNRISICFVFVHSMHTCDAMRCDTIQRYIYYKLIIIVLHCVFEAVERHRRYCKVKHFCFFFLKYKTDVSTDTHVCGDYEAMINVFLWATNHSTCLCKNFSYTERLIF